MFKRCLIALLMACLVIPGNLSAAEEPADVFSLGEVVVKGEAGDVSDVGITQTVTFEDIKATNSSTIADAMKFVPGVTMTRGRKNESEISVHGFGQEKTLFLIDGIPYYETYYGKLNLDQIPVDIVSRIEISKNAPSVLYGANAQVAVVNIITRKGTSKPTMNLTGELGEDSTYKASVSHGNQVGAVNYWVSYLHEESDGWRLSDDYTPVETRRAKKWMPNIDGIHEDGGLRENSDYENDRLWARAGITPAPGSEYFVSAYFMQSEMGHPLGTDEYKIFDRSGDDAAFSTLSRFEDYDDWGIDFSGKHMISEALTLRGKLFYHDHEDVYVSYDDIDFSNAISKSSFKDNYVGGSLLADFSLNEVHSGHISVHYKEDTHKGRDDDYQPYNKYVSHTGSLGTEHQFFTRFGMTIYTGVSYDWFKVEEAEDFLFDDDDMLLGQVDMDTAGTKDEVNPMIGFTWDLEATSFYGSVAQKTRFPTLSELFSSTSGNADLTAEKSINYTLGLTRKFGPRFTVDVSGFYHDISDWISRDYYEDGYTGNEIYTNVEDISMQGIETSMDVIFCDYFSMNFNYTFIDAQNESRQRVTDKVAGVPENKFGVGCKMLIPKVLVNVDLQGIYVDGVYDSLPTTGSPDDDALKTDDYFIMNARISKKFGMRYSLYAEVDNLFDEDYEQEVGFPGEGRNIRAGFTLSL